MRYILPTVLVITLAIDGKAHRSVTCIEQVGNCACKTDDGGWINLKTLDSGNHTNPKFQNIKDYSSNSYSYNPCTAFFSGSCNNVSLCSTTTWGQNYPIGTQESAVFSTDSDWNGRFTKLTYTITTSSGTIRTSYIKLICEPNTEGSMTSQGEGPVAVYDFELTTKYACSDIAPPAHGGGGGRSVRCTEKVGNCACKTDDGGWINLEPLDSRNPALPMFQNIADYSSNTYSYNPCTAFSSGSCTDVSLCETTVTRETFPLGTQESAVFSTDADWNGPYTKLTYKQSTSDGTTRTSNIRLTCDPNTDGSMTATGEGPTTYYDFELTTKYACSDIAPPAHGGGGGRSVTCTEIVGNCACKTDDGGWINLEPLDSRNPALPMFQNIADYSSNTYSYNPCTAFSSGSCTDVSVCQTTGTGETFPIGTQESVVFSTDSNRNGPYTKLAYTHTDSDGTTVTSYIKLICDPNTEGSMTAQGEGPTTIYDFELTTKYACSDIAPPAKTKDSGVGLSLTSFLLIAAFVCCLVCLVVVTTCLIQAKCCKGSETSPPKAFVAAIPERIKESRPTTYITLNIEGLTSGKGSGYEKMKY